jgi:endoglucanase
LVAELCAVAGAAAIETATSTPASRAGNSWGKRNIGNLLSSCKQAAVVGIVLLSRGVPQGVVDGGAWYVGTVPLFIQGAVVFFRLHRLTLLLVIALSTLLALSPHLTAQQRAATPERADGLQTAIAGARHLQRGINTSAWFAQSTDFSGARADRFMDAQDIALIARLGFDNIRIPIDAAALEKYPRTADGMSSEFISRLDRAVDAALANGLAVQIDLHPEDNFKQRLRNGDDPIDRLAMLWRRLAAHYANRNPDLVFFEILNEPEVYDRYRWAGIQTRIAGAIRDAAPHNTIIATGANYSDIPDLLSLRPLADGNVIYNFHFYEPHEFTHQGATWGLSWWSYTHGIAYPPNDAAMQALLSQVPDLPDRYTLENYWLNHWDGRHIRLLIEEAAAWAHQYNVPLICNEFGVYRNNRDPASRINWLKDVRTALEADGIGWAMWEYRGGFGIVDKQDGQPAQADSAVVQALGLKGR